MSSGAVSSLGCLSRSPSFLLRWSCFFRDPGPTRESCLPSRPSFLLRWRCLPRRSCFLSRRGFPLRWPAGTLGAWHRASLIRLVSRHAAHSWPIRATKMLHRQPILCQHRTSAICADPRSDLASAVRIRAIGRFGLLSAICSTTATILYINAFRHSSVADVAVTFAVAPHRQPRLDVTRRGVPGLRSRPVWLCRRTIMSAARWPMAICSVMFLAFGLTLCMAIIHQHHETPSVFRRYFVHCWSGSGLAWLDYGGPDRRHRNGRWRRGRRRTNGLCHGEGADQHAGNVILMAA
jgi:hypothetical protein